MIVPVASALLLVSAVPATAVRFAPPLDKPLRIVTETVRTDGDITRHFVNTRRIVFRRDGEELRAEVTIEGSDPVGPADDPATMARAGFAHIAGRMIVLRLDPGGRVVAVQDHAAVWQAMLDGFAAQAPGGKSDLDRKRAGRVRAIVSALAAMPVERQRQALASLVEPLIAADVTNESAPRPVRMPAASPYGVAALDGIRAVRMVRGRLEASVTAQGSVAIAGPEGAANARIVLEATRTVDPATGLVLKERESVRIIAPDGKATSERTSTSRLET